MAATTILFYGCIAIYCDVNMLMYYNLRVNILMYYNLLRCSHVCMLNFCTWQNSFCNLPWEYQLTLNYVNQIVSVKFNAILILACHFMSYSHKIKISYYRALHVSLKFYFYICRPNWILWPSTTQEFFWSDPPLENVVHPYRRVYIFTVFFSMSYRSHWFKGTETFSTTEKQLKI